MNFVTAERDYATYTEMSVEIHSERKSDSFIYNISVGPIPMSHSSGSHSNILLISCVRSNIDINVFSSFFQTKKTTSIE